MNVLLSIKPVFAEKILNGEKRYEFRKTRLSKVGNGDRVVLYASSPIQKIVGEFQVGGIIEADPHELWNRFSEFSGIDNKEWFLDYFGENALGYAIEVDDVYRFDAPIDPYECIEGFHPPVSFKYINGLLSNGIIESQSNPSHQLPTSACD